MTIKKSYVVACVLGLVLGTSGVVAADRFEADPIEIEREEPPTVQIVGSAAEAGLSGVDLAQRAKSGDPKVEDSRDLASAIEIEDLLDRLELEFALGEATSGAIIDGNSRLDIQSFRYVNDAREIATVTAQSADPGIWESLLDDFRENPYATVRKDLVTVDQGTYSQVIAYESGSSQIISISVEKDFSDPKAMSPTSADELTELFGTALKDLTMELAG